LQLELAVMMLMIHGHMTKDVVEHYLWLRIS